MNEAMPKDAAELFSIDVDAEVRKLCSQQLGACADRLIELVRLLLRWGASSVRLRIRRRSVRLRAVGGQLPPAAWLHLAEVLDLARSASQRHEALVRCETQLGAAGLALLGEPWARLVVRGPAIGLQLTFRSGRVSVERLAGEAGGTSLEALLPNTTPPAELRRDLGLACGYGTTPVLIDGKAATAWRARGRVLSLPIASGSLRGFVALLMHDELRRLVFLQHGVVQHERLLHAADGRAALVVLEDTQGLPADAIAAAQREAVVAVALERLYAELPRRWAALGMRQREAVRDALLRYSRAGAGNAVLRGLPLFETLAGGWADIDGLRAAVDGGGVFSIEPGDRRRRWMGDPARIFVLDRRLRGFVSDVLGIALRQPPVRAADGRWARWLSSWQRLRRQALDAIRAWIARVAGAQLVAMDALRPAERNLLAALQAQLDAGHLHLPGVPPALHQRLRVRFIERGALPARVQRVGAELVWGLARRHHVVHDAVRALQRDPLNLYPACVALLGGQGGVEAQRDAYWRNLLRAG